MEALQRFVGDMECEVIKQKKIAEERRELNQNLDERLENERLTRKRKQHLTEIFQKKQAMTKKNREKEEEILDKVVPHIAGQEGYPARY